MQSFSEISSFEVADNFKTSIIKEIDGKSKEYILGVDENEFKDFLIDKYTLTPLIVDFDKEDIDKPHVVKEWLEDHWRDKYQTDVYIFVIRYPFTGSPFLFQVRPSSYSMTSNEINVNERENTVSFSFKLYSQDADEYKRRKQENQKRAFTNLDNVNNFAQDWNSQLTSIVTRAFEDRKTKYLKENDFFTAINLPIDKSTQSVFTPPSIKKKSIPQPTVNKNKVFTSEPSMGTEMYNDLLKVLYDSGKSMERKPALYANKDEEGLRDQFLFMLETRYEGTTATGETFNRNGKSDILLKHSNDGSNLFVAECKFWHGGSEFKKAISQLFDRYLTWRDSKVAVMMFVSNKSFSDVLDIILDETKVHPYFVRENGKRGESSFSYTFRLPQDPNKNVFLEVMAFHYDKIKS